jgi:thymidylate synthase
VGVNPQRSYRARAWVFVSVTHRWTDPCVSLLDFWLPGGAVELVCYAHSIDFGAKGYGNLVELAWLQRHVAASLQRPLGRLLMVVKSAHVYQTQFGYVRGMRRDPRG